jgi:hypothetical protein
MTSPFFASRLVGCRLVALSRVFKPERQRPKGNQPTTDNAKGNQPTTREAQ